MAKKPNHDELTQSARAQHGRIVSGALPSGELLIFRLPTKAELADYNVDDDNRGPSTRVKQLAYQCCVHPRSEDPSKPVEELRALLRKRSGVATAAVKTLLEMVGEKVELVELDRLPLDLRAKAKELVAKGAERIGVCPDGELVGARCPNEAEWGEFQDSKAPRQERYEALGSAVYVGDKALLDKYPALPGSGLCDAAIHISGATTEFTAKKD